MLQGGDGREIPLVVRTIGQSGKPEELDIRINPKESRFEELNRLRAQIASHHGPNGNSGLRRERLKDAALPFGIERRPGGDAIAGLHYPHDKDHRCEPDRQ